MNRVPWPNFLRRILAQPDSIDAEENQKRLVYLLLAGLGTSLFAGAGALALAFLPGRVGFVPGMQAAAIGVLHLISLILVYLKQEKLARQLLPALLWAGANMATLLFGNPPGWLVMVDIVVILIAGYSLSARTALVYLALCLVCFPIAPLAEATRLFHVPTLTVPNLAGWFMQFSLLVWAGALLALTQSRFKKAETAAALITSQLQANEIELEQAQQEQAAIRQFLENYNRNLERRVTQFQLAAEVARDSAALNEVEVLLTRAVNLVLERFDFYHAGIFLIDDHNEYAVLKAATGEAGQSMLDANHRLKVGEEGMVGYVTATGNHRVALDVQSDEIHFKNPYLPKTRSELTLPLKTGQQMIGALDVQSTRPDAFDTEDIAILQSMADQLAVAIENARLFEATSRQLDELIALHAVANAATEATDENQLIERVTQLIAETLFTDNFGVLLLNESEGMLYYHPSYRSKRTINRSPIPLGVGLIGTCAQTGRSLRVGDVSAEERYRVIDPLTRSELCVPIKIGERLFGVINTESSLVEDFSSEDERVLDTVAGQVATGLQKVRSFANEHRRAVELEALRQASLQLTSSLDIDTVLKAILQNAIRLMAAYTAHIFLYDGEKLEFGMAMWADGEQRTPFSKPQPGGLTQTVASTGKPLAIPDVRKHALFENRAWDGAVIGLPLMHGAQVLGVMNISFDGGPRPFEEHELQVLQLLADQAAIALSNARLYAESQERADQLARALAQREELVRLRNEFIQNVSHELRTPLAITRGYVELLEKEELGPLAKPQLDAIKILNRRVQMLIKLVDDLVTILEAEALDVKVESVNLAELIQRALSDFTPVANQAHLKLQAEIQSETAPVVRGTASHLNRVLDNLLSNALKFTPANGEINIHLSTLPEQVIIEIEDQGIGIPADKLERIFERFYQVDGSTKRRYGGTGLGLALVKEIVESHGGRVKVRSELGHGTTFRIELPLWIEPPTIT